MKMEFNYDPFERHDSLATERTDVLDFFMSWTEEVMAYGKKHRSQFD
jgi:hypothetical protein